MWTCFQHKTCITAAIPESWPTKHCKALSPERLVVRRQLASRRLVKVQASVAVEGQLPESGAPTLPTKLNNTPHAREIRQFFYNDACEAVQNAVRAGETRMRLRCTIPELNPEMDVYRIGTLLELVRELAARLAADGARVKVCVQQAMGQGVFQGLPLSLSGVRRIMERMDWGDSVDFVTFGQVGSDQVDDCRYYILVAPQNVVGNTIMTDLGEMAATVEEAEGKCIILVNPLLKDVPSAAGVMGVRGRGDRMAMADSFIAAYHFRLLYLSSAMMYPIMGALRHSYGDPWQVYKRVDVAKKVEEYRLIGTYDSEPNSGQLTDLWSRTREKPPPNKFSRW